MRRMTKWGMMVVLLHAAVASADDTQAISKLKELHLDTVIVEAEDIGEEPGGNRDCGDRTFPSTGSFGGTAHEWKHVRFHDDGKPFALAKGKVTVQLENTDGNGLNPENPPEQKFADHRYSYGMICVRGDLYMWVSADGKDFTLRFTGGKCPNDAWHSVRGHFSLTRSLTANPKLEIRKKATPDLRQSLPFAQKNLAG